MKTGGVNDDGEYEHGIGLSVRREREVSPRLPGGCLAGYRYADEPRAERELREVGESVGHHFQTLTTVKRANLQAMLRIEIRGSRASPQLRLSLPAAYRVCATSSFQND